MSSPVPAPSPAGLSRLRDFVVDFGALIERGSDEQRLLDEGAPLLAGLVAQDDWLPLTYAQPDPVHYRQYLLHCDSREHFSVVSFVWGPGQMTPIHDHRTWGLVGVLRGGERVESFDRAADGSLVSHGAPVLLLPGQVDAFGPVTGDIHRVANAHDDRVSVSIHVYGANIGRVSRATYDPSGQAKSFVSGYANDRLPNLWGTA